MLPPASSPIRDEPSEVDSAAQVVPSLLSGEVDAVVQLPAALAQYVKSGQVRFLAAMVATRDPAFPDVPTAREEGFDVSLEAWRGIAVPTGTPAGTVAALELAIRNTVTSKEFVQACERLGQDWKRIELVAWLVEHHLLMSATAQKRDVSDPRTVIDFARVVRRADLLRQVTRLHWVATGLAGLALVIYLLVSSAWVLDLVVVLAVVAVVAFAVRFRLNRAPVPRLQR